MRRRGGGWGPNDPPVQELQSKAPEQLASIEDSVWISLEAPRANERRMKVVMMRRDFDIWKQRSPGRARNHAMSERFGQLCLEQTADSDKLKTGSQFVVSDKKWKFCPESFNLTSSSRSSNHIRCPTPTSLIASMSSFVRKGKSKGGSSASLAGVYRQLTSSSLFVSGLFFLNFRHYHLRAKRTSTRKLRFGRCGR